MQLGGRVTSCLSLNVSYCFSHEKQYVCEIILSSSSVIGMNFHQCTSGLATFLFLKSNTSNLPPPPVTIDKKSSVSIVLGPSALPLGLSRRQKGCSVQKIWWWTSDLPSIVALVHDQHTSFKQSSVPFMSNLSTETWQCFKAKASNM